MTNELYAVREVGASSGKGYAVVNPTTNETVAEYRFANGYCEQPIVLPLQDASILAQKLTASSETTWITERAPSPCPGCGREIWASNLDFCYARNHEQTQWRAGCNEHDFGCGYEVEAASFDEVLAAWNAAPRA